MLAQMKKNQQQEEENEDLLQKVLKALLELLKKLDPAVAATSPLFRR
jgi:hypothetical protein